VHVAARVAVLLRVAVVDAVNLRGLEEDLGADFGRAQGGRGVGGEERVPGAPAEDHDAAALQVTHGAPPDVRLCNLAHLYRGLHACLHHNTGCWCQARAGAFTVTPPQHGPSVGSSSCLTVAVRSYLDALRL
jgi:hypothetical protein